jgi:hypothetical protein
MVASLSRAKKRAFAWTILLELLRTVLGPKTNEAEDGENCII